MSSAEAGSSAIGRLEEASQQHETNIVIDLGMDRLVKWIGVYLLLALAVVAKITDAVGTNLSCYPANQSSPVGSDFIAFTTTFCWETSSDSLCARMNISDNIPLLRNPNPLKFFIQWLPYIMLLQGLLFALPWAFWHFRVGARLLGHLKFMQMLLADIFKQLQDIPEALYDDEPYDEKSDNFDGLRSYTPLKQQENSVTVKVVGESKQKLLDNQPAPPSTSSPSYQNQTQSSTNQPVQDSPVKETKSLTTHEKLIVGDMRDRNFFSMLCYENFASMYHLPYILSVFKLCEEIGKREPDINYYQLNESILYQWCHRKNFNNIFLIKTYLYKHILTAILSFIMFIVMTLSLVAIYDDVTSSETFACQLPYDEMCALCTIRRKRDVIAMFVCDYILIFLMFGMSLGNWLVVRSSSNRATCHYFDHMKETCNVALLTAKKAKQE